MTAKNKVKQLCPNANIEKHKTGGCLSKTYYLVRKRGETMYIASGDTANEAWRKALAILTAKKWRIEFEMDKGTDCENCQQCGASGIGLGNPGCPAVKVETCEYKYDEGVYRPSCQTYLVCGKIHITKYCPYCGREIKGVK